LIVLRHHALADDAPRKEHTEPPLGSLRLPERATAHEKVAALRHVMSPSALRKMAAQITREALAETEADSVAAEEEAADEDPGPGELEEGVDWEDVAEGVYLLSEHTKTKREGHVFTFRLRKRDHTHAHTHALSFVSLIQFASSA
jgi:hypothetical protein